MEYYVKHFAPYFLAAGAVFCLHSATNLRAQEATASTHHLSSASAVKPARRYAPASVRALPDLECKLYPVDNPSAAVPVFTDDDGFARFHAVRPTAKEDVRQMTLSCQDAAGRKQ